MTQTDSSYDGDTIPMAREHGSTYASGSAAVGPRFEPIVVWPPDVAQVGRRRSPRARAAFLLAALALVIAVAATGMAWRAVERLGGPPGADDPAPAAPEPDSPVDDGTGGGVQPTLDGFTMAYAGQPLVLTARCGSVMYADIDEPRGNVEPAGADLRLRRGCADGQPSVLELGDDVDGSVSATPGMTPPDCLEMIRTAPVGDATIEVHKGVSLCLTTSAAAALSRGENWRVALLVVTAVAVDGAVSLDVTAWNASQPAP
jgi:hypothetical protein